MSVPNSLPVFKTDDAKKLACYKVLCGIYQRQLKIVGLTNEISTLKAELMTLVEDIKHERGEDFEITPDFDTVRKEH